MAWSLDSEGLALAHDPSVAAPSQIGNGAMPAVSGHLRHRKRRTRHRRERRSTAGSAASACTVLPPRAPARRALALGLATNRGDRRGVGRRCKPCIAPLAHAPETQLVDADATCRQRHRFQCHHRWLPARRVHASPRSPRCAMCRRQCWPHLLRGTCGTQWSSKKGPSHLRLLTSARSLLEQRWDVPPISLL